MVGTTTVCTTIHLGFVVCFFCLFFFVFFSVHLTGHGMADGSAGSGSRALAFLLFEQRV